MVPNDALTNFLRRQLNYTHKRQTERVSIYKLRGNTRRVAVRKNAQHSPEYAKSVLRLAGASDDQIEKFLNQSCN